MHNLILKYADFEHSREFRIAGWQAWHGMEFERSVFPSYRSTELSLFKYNLYSPLQAHALFT